MNVHKVSDDASCRIVRLRYEKSREMWRERERFSHKRLADEWRKGSGREKSKRHDDKLLFSSEKPVNNRQRAM